jgi:branched-subunit amino acid aminotransferase/4-amino-4-deoxychorismate lyase
MQNGAVITINGRPATVEAMRPLATANYGHFTLMQMREGGVRGFPLHLDRLDQGSRLLFGQGIDRALVTHHVRAATSGLAEATVRINVFTTMSLRGPVPGAPLDVMVTVTPPVAPDFRPIRVKSLPYRRDLPVVKHVGGFGLVVQRRLAQAAGFDDALFVDAEGEISEGSIWNIGFHDGTRIVWPAAPALLGITMLLLRHGLSRRGIPWEIARLTLADLPRFRNAFLCNSIAAGQPIAAVDGHGYAIDPDFTALLQACEAETPWRPAGAA